MSSGERIKSTGLAAYIGATDKWRGCSERYGTHARVAFHRVPGNNGWNRENPLNRDNDIESARCRKQKSKDFTGNFPENCLVDQGQRGNTSTFTNVPPFLPSFQLYPYSAV